MLNPKSFLILLSFFSLRSSAKQLMELKIPASYHQVMEVEGDLDKDGQKEVVFVYDTGKKDGDLGFFRVLYICKIVNGKTKVWKRNTSVLRSSKDCGFCVDNGIDLNVEIKNNALIIEQTFNHNSRHYSKVRNVFRYQNANWFLIGSTYNDYDTCDFDFKYDINFSTKHVVVAETYGTCDEEKEMPEDRFYKFKFPFKSIPTMDGFKPGKVALAIPNSKRHFFY